MALPGQEWQCLRARARCFELLVAGLPPCPLSGAKRTWLGERVMSALAPLE